MKSAKISVFGDVMLDEYWNGNVSRISPEAPIPIFNFKTSETKLGGAANVAANIASYGAECNLFGLVGNDAESIIFENLTKSHNVTNFCEKIPGYMTIQKIRIISNSAHMLRIDKELSRQDLTDYVAKSIKKYIDKIFENLLESKVLVFSDYNKGALINCNQIINKLPSNIISLVDPKGEDFSKYYGASILTPNFSEFQKVVGNCSSEADIEAKARNLIDKLSLDYLLITRSENGMTLFNKDSKMHFEVTSRNVFDVTGAGDTVIATLAYYLASGTKVEEAVKKSNIAAGIAVTRLGAATVKKEDIDYEFNKIYKA